MAIGIGIGLPFGKKATPNPVAQAPVNTTAPVISPAGNQVIGTLFTANSGSWFATRPLTFDYRWTRNGTPISGATSQTYTSVSADEGQTLRCEVRGVNAFGTSAYVASSNSSTGVSLPVNTVAPVISGSTTLGSVLTTTDGTWTGTAPITFSYQWKRGGISIGGATASTYTLVAADSSANIICEVTGTNVAGSVAANSNTITAANFNPVNTIAPTLSPSGTQSTGTIITLGNGTWTGASPITFEYRWTRNNIVISGQTSNTYTIVAGDDGTVIKGEVRGTNSLSTSAYVVTSNQVDAVAFDADAVAFFSRVTTAGGTLSGTERTAVNQLVLDMKSAGIWNSMKVIYPMVGSSAAACAQNLKSASFMGTFSSGWTFASTGVTPNGTSAFMNTSFNPSIDSIYDNTHFSLYSRTQVIANSVDIGAQLLTNRFTMELAYGGFGFASDQYNDTTGRVSLANSITTGLYTSNRTTSNIFKCFRNSIQLGSTNTGVSGTMPNMPVAIGASNRNNIPVFFSSKEFAFSSIGDGLTDTQVANLFTAVQTFQTTLSRQV